VSQKKRNAIIGLLARWRWRKLTFAQFIIEVVLIMNIILKLFSTLFFYNFDDNNTHVLVSICIQGQKTKRSKDKNINLTLQIHIGKDRFRNWVKRELTDKQELQNQSTNNIGLIFQSNGKCFSFLSTTKNMGLIFP